MNDAEMVVVSNEMPVLKIAQMVERRSLMVKFVKAMLVQDTDFGVIPGTGNKPTLLKPGAEKLCTFFGLRPTFEAVQAVEDWTGRDHDGEAFFYYWMRCRLVRAGEIMAEGDGSCSSRESKYRYRQGERTCPKCGKAAIRKSKEEYGGGWYCNAKAGGCAAKFSKGDKTIEGQDTGRIFNPDVADQQNTILKMAQKRALIAATLIGVNASEFFTQDVEDMAGGEVIESTARDVTPAPTNGHGKAQPVDVIDHDAEATFREMVSASQTTKIGDAERRKLFGSAKGLFADNDAFRAWVHDTARVDSTNDLTLAQYQDLLNRLDVMKREQQA